MNIDPTFRATHRSRTRGGPCPADRRGPVPKLGRRQRVGRRGPGRAPNARSGAGRARHPHLDELYLTYFDRLARRAVAVDRGIAAMWCPYVMPWEEH